MARKRVARSAGLSVEPVSELIALSPRPSINFLASSGAMAAIAVRRASNTAAAPAARKTRRFMMSVRLRELRAVAGLIGQGSHRIVRFLAVLDRIVAILAIQAADRGVVVDRSLADRIQRIEIARAQVDALDRRAHIAQRIEIVVMQ